MLHWIPKPIIDSIHIQSLLYLLLWFGVFIYKTCRNTSKDLGHNSRTRRASNNKKWWRLFKIRTPELKERAAQMCESQRADAKLTDEEWRTYDNVKLHPALSRVNMKAQRVYNHDDNGYFRSFLVNIGEVLAHKGRR